MILRSRTRRARFWNMGLLFLIYYCVTVYSVKSDGEKDADLSGIGEDGPTLNEPGSGSDEAKKLESGPDESAGPGEIAGSGEAPAPGEVPAPVETAVPSSTMPTYTKEEPYSTYRSLRYNCTPPAIEQFPRPWMGRWLRQHGGLIIHVLVAIFTFFGLAIVCDDYFVASMDRLCEELKLSPDVAGATFMAAGSSAPELATVVIGVFFAKDDIGISGVIGSAVFNIMFVISICALCSGTVCQLNWWPMVRDCFFYCLSILIMLIVISNDYISCFESIVMLLCYVGYCVALNFNTQLERWALSLNLPFKLPTKEEQSSLVTYKNVPENTYTQGGGNGGGNGQQQTSSLSQDPKATSPQQQQSSSTDYQNYNDPNASWDPNAAWGDESAAGAAAAKPVSSINDNFSHVTATNDDWGMSQFTSGQGQENMGYNADQPDSVVAHSTSSGAVGEAGDGKLVGKPQAAMVEKTKEARVDPLMRPTEGGLPTLISWYIMYPIHFMCHWTIPDCRLEKYRNWYPCTFLMSMLWISFYSYFMVWMITIVGSTLTIPDTVMGLTFVAAGVSVPDALSSIAVIKEGFGDMAVSNAIGSNVFDILVCLGLPWFIQTAIIKPGSHVNVISKGLTYSTLSLFSTVVFLILSTHFNGWKLDKRLGIILMLWYFFFITMASLYELNVFGNMHPPECQTVY